MRPSSRPTVLVFATAAIRAQLEAALPALDLDLQLSPTPATDGDAALRLCLERRPDVVLIDDAAAASSTSSGAALLGRLHDAEHTPPVVSIVGTGAVEQAVAALKAGAHDVLSHPLDGDRLRDALIDASAEAGIEARTRVLERALDRGAGLGPLIGDSPPMRKLFELLRVLAENEASAILCGESGTGKELAARTIHALSARHGGPFLALNTAAIPEGLTESELFGHDRGAFTGAVAGRAGCFELADGGTLFLDELLDMPAALQPKFLRIIEDGRVRRLGGRRESTFDVRLLAATNRDPRQAIRRGRLRRDLYYRLEVFTVHLPPLRQRLADLPLLAQHFIRRFNQRYRARVAGLTDPAREQLLAYPWPGNVRELRNVIERAVILARDGRIGSEHLPATILRPPADAAPGVQLPPGVSHAEAERILILETLRQTGNNKAEAARRLGIDVKTIRNKLRAWAVPAVV